MHVTLGRPVAGDTPAISMAMMDPKVSGWLHSFPFPHDASRSRGARPGASGPADYAVRVDGHFAGLVIASPELGCWIDPRYQGSGIATRAAMLALSRLFLAGSRMAHARFLPDNPQMKAMLDRLGFVPDTALGDWPGHPDLDLLILRIEDFVRAQPFDVKTPRLHLSGVSDGDLVDLYDIAALRDVFPNLTFFAPSMPLDAFARILSPFGGIPPFWATIRVDGRIIGGIGLESRPFTDRTATTTGARFLLHCFLRPEAMGLGLGSEAMQAFVDELRDRYGCLRIEAEVFSDDHVTRHLVDACGFMPVGTPILLVSPTRSAAGQLHRLHH